VVSLCLALLNDNQWITGLYRIVCWIPFVDAKRFSVCFMLTLHQLVTLPPLSLANFRQLLNPDNIPEDGLPAIFMIEEPKMRWIDYFLMILTLTGAICLWKTH
jgi:hypothetical protein